MTERELSSFYDGINYFIQKEKEDSLKVNLSNCLEIIKKDTISNAEKKKSYEALINYISHLPTWEEEIITFLTNQMMNL